MAEDEIVIVLCLVIIGGALLLKKRKRKPRRWVRTWIGRRNEYGTHSALLQELSNENARDYRNFLRMDKCDFEDLLKKIRPSIQRHDTNMREAISPAERLSITLRFLATGDSYQSLEYLYRIPISTLSGVIPETCQAIYECLYQDYMKVPNTKEEWEKIATEFYDKWNFPNCLGAMDGKHVAIKCPSNSGSNFYNYKHFFSIVLFAIVDADYKFIYVDVGRNGRISDSGIFANTPILQKLELQELGIPSSKPLPGRIAQMPYTIVGDDAFPLKTYLMKPYPSRDLDITKRIFNYRLSRARRIVENAFGTLTSRFGIFQKTIPLEPEKVKKIILACCALHNFLRSKPLSRNIYTPSGFLDRENTENGQVLEAEWRQCGSDLPGIPQQGGNRTTLEARAVRDELCDYFNTNGAVEWQWNVV